MALNFPGPYQIRIYYSSAPGGVASLFHSMRLNVDLTSDPAPGSSFADVDAVNHAAATKQLDTVLSEFIALLQPLYSAANTAFNYAELWYCVPNSFEQNFIATQDISLAGSAGGNNVQAAQNIYVFRTREGGTMRVNLMENITQYAAKISYSSMNADQKALCDYITDNVNEGWFLGQDTSYPFATVALYPGQNERLFKLRYRPNS